MPSLRPINPETAIAMALLELDLHVDAGGEVELAEGVDGLLRRLEDVEQALVGADLELLARLLVDVRRAVHREALDVRRERDGTRDAATGAADRVDDLPHRLVEEPVVVGAKPDADLLVHPTRSLTRRSWSPRPHRR